MSVILALVCLSACEPTLIKVIDGDTISMKRVVYRIEGINAPELRGQCEDEKRLAKEAKRYLSGLLQSGPISFSRSSTDRYGRTLATFTVNGDDVGLRLVRDGLARTWTKKWNGKRDHWCD